MKQISESEKQIMDIIWRNERALTTAEILKQLPKNKSWKQTTVGTFLSRLTKKNIIKSTRVGRAYHYEACISEEQYRLMETKHFINDVHKGSVSGFLQTLADSGDLTKSDIKALMEKLRE